jgi:hypothetical protein
MLRTRPALSQMGMYKLGCGYSTFDMLLYKLTFIFICSWKAAGGDDLVCGCCDSSCAVSKARDLDSDLGKCQSKPELYYQFKM